LSPPSPAATSGEEPENEFRLVSIRPSPAPAGSAGRDWFRYRIEQGANLINGYRRGELAAVTADVERIVAGLNERRIVKRGRVDLKPNRPTAATAAATATATADKPAA
jgi:hypothetical protein